MAVVSGGTTLIDNGALDSAVPTGALTLLSTQTASSSASISFTSGIDSTYNSYVFKFINIHPATDNTDFMFNASIDNGSNDNDQNSSGYMQLFNPSSTTFVKHFIANGNSYNYNDYSNNNFTAGYFNTTSAIDAVRFQMSSGNIDDGIIKLYGVK
jgi:hypothetical protein